MDWASIGTNESIDPEWGGGAIQFSLSLYYGILPRSMGGDKKLSSEYLNKSIETGPDWLIGRWGRAKYFYVMKGNKEGFKTEMQWIADQNIDQVNGEYAWNVYFQEDAKKSLLDINQYF